jgi:hypothetical protein
MGMSLDIHSVAKVEFNEVREYVHHSSRTITITTDSGEQVELNLYAKKDDLNESAGDRLKFLI